MVHDTFARGVSFHRRGSLAEAIRSYQEVLQREPTNAAALNLLGLACFQQGDGQRGLLLVNQALSIRPDLPGARYNLGTILQALGRNEDAVAQYEKAIVADANDFQALNNLGTTLRALSRDDEAISCYERAVLLRPDYVEAQYNLGNALHKLGRYEEALQRYRHAVTIKPELAEFHHNLGDTLQLLDRYEEALDEYDQAIALKPDHARSKFNKGVVCLALGRLAEGWKLHEENWAANPGNKPRPYGCPRWNGGRVATLLIWGEQGLGDQILHSSIVEDAARRVDNVVMEVEPRLVDLFRRSFSGVHVIPLDEALYPGPVDAHVPISSLGSFLRTSWDQFPRRQQGYLVADRSRVTALRARLKCDERLVIGLSWISTTPRHGASKSAKLRDLTSILRLPGCRFVDLQYGDTSAERQAIEHELGVHIEKLTDIDNTKDIDDLAALVSACDAVVSVSNTTAHLAGALGVPTWTLVPHGHANIWYWFKQHRDSPWYPAVRVRHQQREQGWHDLASSIQGELRKS